MSTLIQAKRAVEAAQNSLRVRRERGENTDPLDQMIERAIAELQAAASLRGLQRKAGIRRVDSILKMTIGHGIEKTYQVRTSTRWGKGL